MKNIEVKLLDSESKKIITVYRLTRKQHRVLNAKTGAKYNTATKVMEIRDQDAYMDLLLEASTGLSKPEIDELSVVDFSRLTQTASKLVAGPTEEELNFLLLAQKDIEEKQLNIANQTKSEK